ncbi:MAG: Gfo/Idh/MocA family oxidoreductase [Acidobacteriota bacterium]|nr:Gfo/Idh/MocA family oxidoreductase [Acidobacteriota bacterium]
MAQAPVRFAILGFGHHAIRRLVPAFRQCTQATLVGLWRRDAAAAAANAAEFGIPHVFATREALCASPEVDAVFITSPDAMHLDDLQLAVASGKAVLCEKPVAMNATDAAAMVTAAQRARMLYGVGQNFRYNRSLVWLQQQIAAGNIGEPQLAHAQFTYPAASSQRRWIMDPGLACGGPLADVGVHCVDALRFVTGREVSSVSTLARTDAISSAVDAVASLQLEMTGGIFADVTVSGRSPYRTLVEVVGSEGVLIAENGLTVDRPVELVRRRAGDVMETVTVDNADGYTLMLDSFARAMHGTEVFAASGEDAVANMRVLDAAMRSWKTGQRERV